MNRLNDVNDPTGARRFALGGSRPHTTSTAPMDLGGYLLMAAVIFAALCLIFAVVVFAGLWMAMHVPLRFILEALPLSIAETANGEGNPVQVGAVIGALVVVAMIVASVWRRGVVARAIQEGSGRRTAFLSSLVRTVVLFAGLGLVVTSAGIAAGGDLPGSEFVVRPPGGDGEASGGLGSALLFLLLAFGAIATYSFVSANRVWQKVATRLGR